MLILSLDKLQEALHELKKETEKTVIRTWVASQVHASSENRKKMMKVTKENTIQELKSYSSSYVASFSTSAKGQWVTQAKNAVKETTNSFKNF